MNSSILRQIDRLRGIDTMKRLCEIGSQIPGEIGYLFQNIIWPTYTHDRGRPLAGVPWLRKGQTTAESLARAIEDRAGLAEREIIVAWLRNVAAGEPDSLTRSREVGHGRIYIARALDADKIADAIERGEHHESKKS